MASSKTKPEWLVFNEVNGTYECTRCMAMGIVRVGMDKLQMIEEMGLFILRHKGCKQ
jgi:hypothetical protein